MPSPPCIIRTKTIAHCEILQLTCLPQGKNESKCEQMIRRQRLDERRHSKKRTSISWTTQLRRISRRPSWAREERVPPRPQQSQRRWQLTHEQPGRQRRHEARPLIF